MKKENLMTETKPKQEPKRWTKEEVALLVEEYPKTTPDLAAKLFPGRTKSQVYLKARTLGLRPVNAKRRYSAEELAAIVDSYEKTGRFDADCAEGRTQKALQVKALRLGLSIDRVKTVRAKGTDMYGGWTPEEIATLDQAYREGGATLAKRKLAGRTSKQISSMAKNLGIPCGKFWSDDEIAILKEKWHEIGTAVVEELNEKTEADAKEKAHKLRLPCPRTWTRDLDLKLLDGWLDDGVEGAMRATGRSLGSVHGRLRQLGIKFIPKPVEKRDAKPWSEAEMWALDSILKTGTIADASAALGRTCSACSTAAYRFGLHERSAIVSVKREGSKKRIVMTNAEKAVVYKAVATHGPASKETKAVLEKACPGVRFEKGRFVRVDVNAKKTL